MPTSNRWLTCKGGETGNCSVRFPQALGKELLSNPRLPQPRDPA